MNHKEVLAMAMAAERWMPLWCNKHVILHCDKQAAVAIINKGSTRNPLIMNFLYRLFCSVIMRDKNTINELILENRRETKHLMDIIYHKNVEIEKLKDELVVQKRLHEKWRRIQVDEEITSPVRPYIKQSLQCNFSPPSPQETESPEDLFDNQLAFVREQQRIQYERSQKESLLKQQRSSNSSNQEQRSPDSN